MWLFRQILIKVLVANINLFILWRRQPRRCCCFHFDSDMSKTCRCYCNCHNFTCYLKGRVISNGKEVGFILYLFLRETYNLYCVPQAFFPYFSSPPVFFLIAWMPYGITALLSFIWLSPAGSCIWAPDPWPQPLLNLCEASKRFNKRPEKWVSFFCC